jgi:transcriptional regulator with XRE-family HTH domain
MSDQELQRRAQIGAIVRERRTAKHLSQSELGLRIGANQQTIDKIERGLIRFSSYYPALSAELEIDLTTFYPHAQSTLTPARKTDGPPKELLREDVPVYGVRVLVGGGFALTDEPVDFVAAPPLAVRGSYNIIVPDDSMVPELCAGDRLAVNPHLPPIKGRTCLFFSEREGVVIRHLINFTDTIWRVRAWNVAQDIELSRQNWPTCHVVMCRCMR